MNPLDLPGPAFLAFYVVFCIFVSIGLRVAIGLGETGQPGGLPVEDPYKIAWLRGGTPEAVRVALLVLIDRGLLELDKRQVRPRPAELWGRNWHPFERAVYNAVSGPTEAGAILRDPAVLAAADTLNEQLAKAGLTPDAAAEGRRWLFFAGALVLEIGMAMAKADVALARGKQNLGFLFLLVLFGAFALWLVSRRRRTRRGDAALADLRRLFGGLRATTQSAQPGAMTRDALLLAAVFGLGAMSDPAFAAVRSFFPASSGSSGSSCGSSGGDGGSCGGGGCGGCSS